MTSPNDTDKANGTALATILGGVSQMNTTTMTTVIGDLTDRATAFDTLVTTIGTLSDTATTEAKSVTGEGDPPPVYTDILDALKSGSGTLSSQFAAFAAQLRKDAAALQWIRDNRTQLEHDGAANVNAATANT